MYEIWEEALIQERVWAWRRVEGILGYTTLDDGLEMAERHWNYSRPIQIRAVRLMLRNEDGSVQTLKRWSS